MRLYSMKKTFFNKRFTIVYSIVFVAVAIVLGLFSLAFKGNTAITTTSYIFKFYIPYLVMGFVAYFPMSLYLYGGEKLKLVSYLIGILFFLLCISYMLIMIIMIKI